MEKEYEFFKKSEIAIRVYESNKRATTLEEAWRKTFEKWDLIINSYEVITNHPTQVVRTCGLCDVFFSFGCSNCPIGKVGFSYCRNKEYMEWEAGKEYQDDIIGLAIAELEFLKKVFNGTIEQTTKGDS